MGVALGGMGGRGRRTVLGGEDRGKTEVCGQGAGERRQDGFGALGRGGGRSRNQEPVGPREAVVLFLCAAGRSLPC